MTKKTKGVSRPFTVHGEPLPENIALSAFQWARVIQISGEPYTALPDWVIKYLGDLAATYFERGVAARKKGEKPPSLDTIAGLPGGKRTAWTEATKRFEATILKFYLDKIVTAAKQDRPQDTVFTLYGRQESGEPWPSDAEKSPPVLFTDGNIPPIPVLDKRKQPTKAFQAALAQMLGVSGRHSAVASYETVRRRLTLAR